MDGWGYVGAYASAADGDCLQATVYSAVRGLKAVIFPPSAQREIHTLSGRGENSPLFLSIARHWFPTVCQWSSRLGWARKSQTRDWKLSMSHNKRGDNKMTASLRAANLCAFVQWWRYISIMASQMDAFWPLVVHHAGRGQLPLMTARGALQEAASCVQPLWCRPISVGLHRVSN